MIKHYSASEFTPTQWDTAQDKARFANQFVSFIHSGFNARFFTDRFYRRLSQTFGHIAHYNRGGFWAEFFTSTEDIVRFLEQTLAYPCYGDPEWTYSDVERALQFWLLLEGVLNRYRDKLATEKESKERAEYQRLQQKYG
jgi:hypothetical protein